MTTTNTNRESEMNQTTMVAIDPSTGRHLRAATAQEVSAWEVQPARHPSFRKPVRVGVVLVDEYAGPGRQHWPVR